ncbi:hypothetical protein SKAU_G00414510 [Synaphobranchus kaupii]|uniref:Uncharacterized protein n=1 Tax=Synaphobranchus kaupii TaxID=118154 RepID=A0A9Q1E738_SYNKA|nr:hypothetical protein SKAU_G00414510 [Synaphobranchus kaupii]
MSRRTIKKPKRLQFNEEEEGDRETSPSPSGNERKVKLGDDCNVTVSSHCWETAKGQATASGMTRVLLLGLFPIEVLLKSNLTGGKNKHCVEVPPSIKAVRDQEGDKRAFVNCGIN